MNTAIIVGSGKGTRMNEKVNKIFLSLTDKPIIYHTIKAFEDCSLIDGIVLVSNEEGELKRIIERNHFKKIKKIVRGGEKRQDSAYNGLKAVNGKDEDIILIHNAANPFITGTTIKKVIDAAKEHGACAAAIKAKDTIKEADKNGFAIKTLDREKMWQMQTPQAMKFSMAKRAFEKAYQDKFYGTDDAMLVERLGGKVKIVETEHENFKITTQYDLETARRIEGCSRAGLGMDSHGFSKEKKPLVLAGFLIKGENGLEANSDGDVILHALFNALSQAIGGRSIGCYADKMCIEEGVSDSKEYLKVILKEVKEKNYRINNVGIMVEAKKPRLEQYWDGMKEALSSILGITKDAVGITFTSGDDLTDFGKGLGIQAFAVCTVRKCN